MSAETRRTTVAALRQLVDAAGVGRLTWIGILMAVSSLTEGIGLLLLVPITGVIAGEGAGLGELGRYLAPLQGMPVELLLASVVGLVVFRAVIVYLVLEAKTQLGFTMTRNIRIDTYTAVLGAEWRWLSGQSSASHAARIVGEADRVGSLGEDALSVATWAITGVVLIATAFAISWQLTAVSLFAAGVVAIAVVLLRARKLREGERYGEAYQAMQEQVTNGLFHLRAARIGGAEVSLASRFARTARAVEESELRFHRSVALAHVAFQAIAAAMLGALIYVALLRFHTPLTVLVPVLAIMARLVPIASGIQHSVRRWTFNRPALDALHDLVAQARAHQEHADDGSPPPVLRERLELRGVSLRYPGRQRPVFDDFDLSIAAGCVVAICGPSGVGKSSLADMLGGLISPDAGEVAIDGEVLRDGARVRWRRRVAYVEQVPYLFDGTIAENLCWGLPGHDDAALERALDRAAALSFVQALPLGLQTRVGEAGRQFSGGERQRLALARALLREPDLLILDEVTAALDGANENAVRGTIRALKGSCTILILGHRAGLLELADQIVDLGTHATAP